MEMSCERFPIGGNFSSDVELEHLERYRYSAAFVNGAESVKAQVARYWVVHSYEPANYPGLII